MFLDIYSYFKTNIAVLITYCNGILLFNRDPLQIYISCSVNENLAKFQISRKRKKVLCHIPKREDGTVGELVIQNVAPVPFHTMILWDGKQHDKK